MPHRARLLAFAISPGQGIQPTSRHPDDEGMLTVPLLAATAASLVVAWMVATNWHT